MKDSAAIIYSGGMDSFTLLHQLIVGAYESYISVHAITFNYGQRHEKEVLYAKNYCDYLGIDHRIIDMRHIGQALMWGSALTSNDIPVPEGHYAEPTMKQTVVPNRNMIMLSLAMGYCVNLEIADLYTAVHAGDHAIYPDCRPAFINLMKAIAEQANYHPVKIRAPYLYLSKGEIAKIGADLQVDYAKAWTCYNGREKPCGKCGACVERIEAMEFAGITDPLEYE